MAGPPYTDFTPVNKSCKGIDGEPGQLMLQFGKLIKRIQQHPLQNGSSLFFLVENVRLTGKDMQAASTAFGVETTMV
jgi:site-specific DNA-cytosine methylase